MKDVMKLFEDSKAVLDSLDIPYSKRITDVKVNHRAKTRWGCSWCKKIGGKHYYRIEIAASLLEDYVPYESAMNTMIHEVLHCHFQHRGHKGEWKRCAEIINKAYPQYNITRTASAEEQGVVTDRIATYKYIITCERCGCVNYYQRKSKVVKLIEHNSTACRCGRCGHNTFKLTVM